MDQALRNWIMDVLMGKPLVGNAFRGLLVEGMLASLLGPEWTWSGGDWASFDFMHESGLGLEVRQSAARQSWHGDNSPPSVGRFDVAARTGRYEGERWIAEPSRAAALYVFAWHPISDRHAADHRNVEQWEFYVTPATDLPKQKSIGLAPLRRFSLPCRATDLAIEVALKLARLN